MKNDTLVNVVVILVTLLTLCVGFNTLDQMVIRYKYYDYWRTLDTWEMCYFWKPHWWLCYIASVVCLWISGFCAAVVVLIREKHKHIWVERETNCHGRKTLIRCMKCGYEKRKQK